MSVWLLEVEAEAKQKKNICYGEKVKKKQAKGVGRGRRMSRCKYDS
jgi:hypothetical protein